MGASEKPTYGDVLAHIDALIAWQQEHGYDTKPLEHIRMDLNYQALKGPTWIGKTAASLKAAANLPG